MVKLKKVETKEDFEKGVEALTSIFIEEYPYYSTWISNHINQFINGEKQILEVVKDSEIVGYFMIHFSTNKVVKINGIYIFEEFKGHGIASDAIVELLNMLKNNFVDLVYVQTRLDNNAVVRLFDKTNFKLIGTNYHEVEQKNNWVACNKLNNLISNEQEIASMIYDGFDSLNQNEVLLLREKHKTGNLVLKKRRKNNE